MATNPFKTPDVEAALNKRYVLGLEIRVGGQGVVYRATRVRDGSGASCSNDVALKLHLDSKQDERVEREISAAKNLRHPALATILEEGTIVIGGKANTVHSVGLYCGRGIRRKAVQGAISEPETVRIARDVTLAIRTLWSKHIVHRDIAPKNIMVKADGSAVLIDLGGARHLDNTTITAPGATFGTPG